MPTDLGYVELVCNFPGTSHCMLTCQKVTKSLPSKLILTLALSKDGKMPCIGLTTSLYSKVDGKSTIPGIWTTVRTPKLISMVTKVKAAPLSELCRAGSA
jgi:hypothetical protein